MSELLRPGTQTTEHKRAWRCEMTGNALLLIALALIFWREWRLVATFAILGTLLVLGACAMYIWGRSIAKGAVSRPPVR